MPDEPLRILIEDGVSAWNDWRRANPAVELNFDAANLAGRDLRGAELSGTVLFEAYLTNANLSRARLRGAVLQGADLRKADLTEADLTDADLSGTWPGDPISRLAWPSGADLSGANLREAAFCRTNVTGTNLARARLYRTIFADVDLSDAQGLEEISHEGPSEISVSTFHRSRGRIPESFLHGTGSGLGTDNSPAEATTAADIASLVRPGKLQHMEAVNLARRFQPAFVSRLITGFCVPPSQLLKTLRLRAELNLRNLEPVATLPV